jgi:2-keto-3-deoxy-L-rhamnonate aldolase RhmA
MTNSLSNKLRSKSPLLGGFVSFNTPYAAQVMARCGFDWLLIDMEHSPISALQATEMVHATVTASQGACVPIIRTPSHGVEWIKWALDSGVSGIIVPMVNNKAEMDEIVKRAKYPPRGQRSSGPFRTPFADLDERTTSFGRYLTERVKDVALLPMIESVEGLENAEAILSTESVNGVFIGPVDLRNSMGLSGSDGTEEEYVRALQKILNITKRLGIPAGILGSQDALSRQVEMGFDYFLLAGDAGLLVLGAELALNKAQASVGAANVTK